jgi:hypothetical protein
MTKKWTKGMDKILNEIMEEKDEISLLDKERTMEDKLIDLFGRFCSLGNGLISNGLIDKRTILIVLNKNGKIKEFDVSNIEPEKVKNLLKTEEMLGYIMSVHSDKVDRLGNKHDSALIRTLYTPNLFRKSIWESKHSEPIVIESRKNCYDCFDMWSLTERPRK